MGRIELNYRQNNINKYPINLLPFAFCFDVLFSCVMVCFKIVFYCDYCVVIDSSSILVILTQFCSTVAYLIYFVWHTRYHKIILILHLFP